MAAVAAGVVVPSRPGLRPVRALAVPPLAVGRVAATQLLPSTQAIQRHLGTAVAVEAAVVAPKQAGNLTSAAVAAAVQPQRLEMAARPFPVAGAVVLPVPLPGPEGFQARAATAEQGQPARLHLLLDRNPLVAVAVLMAEHPAQAALAVSA
tara:strand:- start:324 stop:776 length:453 start_codon:yes stop_codon:yes gene_type:complete